MAQTFDCFVTSVDKNGPFLKICGQTNRQASCFVEKLLVNLTDKFNGNGQVPQLTDLVEGMLCCAKYKDDVYYRASIRNIKCDLPGFVEVKFIDYGNIEIIQIENIRLIDHLAEGLAAVEPQASEFYLAGVLPLSNEWSPAYLSQIQQEIAYVELKCGFVGIIQAFQFIQIIYNDNDLADYLVSKGYAKRCSFEEQVKLLHHIVRMATPVPHKPQFHNSQTKELCSYKNMTLEANSEHMVYISYVEDGPNLFSVQLQSMEQNLERLMNEVNNLPLLPLTEPPVPGFPCLARCLEDNSLCRAVVTNIVGEECKTYYVDFGNTDNLPFSHIFQIPIEFILPKVMSMRFTLAGIKKLKLTIENKCAFKEFVTNKMLKLKVLKLGGSPVLQHCELYEDGKNIVNILYEVERHYKTVPIAKDSKYDVIVSYIEGCKKFFVQLKNCSNSLNSLMLALAAANNSIGVLDESEIKVGLICSAFYAVDEQWYRARIVSIKGNLVTVKYVDYGNEDTVSFECLKPLSNEFMNMLPAQAIECCLYGYQNMKFNTEIENVFESLTLECEFSMMVINIQSTGVLLVDLFDLADNNVAALLIEKLAEKNSHLKSLPSKVIANELLKRNNQPQENFLTNNTAVQPTWRNTNETAQSSPEENKPSWRDNTDEPKSWRNTSKPNADIFKKSYGDGPANQPSRDHVPGNSYRGDTGFKRKPYEDRKPFTANSPTSPLNRNSRSEFSSNRNQPDGDKSSFRGDQTSTGRQFAKPAPRAERNRDSEFNKPNRDSEFNKPNREFQKKPYGDRKPFGETSPKKSYDSDGSSTSDGRNRRGPNRSNNNNRSAHNDNRTFDKPSKPSYQCNEKSFNNRFDKSLGSKNNFKPKDLKSPERKTLPPQDLAPFDQPFTFLDISPNLNCKMAISWFHNPEDFYCQMIDNQTAFKDMMSKIQTSYDGRGPVSGSIAAGSSVIAEFSEDKVLYRALVLEVLQNKYKVQYVDFGNVAIVDGNKLWQVEKQFMELPIQAVRCGLMSIKANEEVWPNNEKIDNLFNKDTFVGIFQTYEDERYRVELIHNDVSVKQQLIDLGLAIDCIPTFDPLEEQVDISLLIGQCLRARLCYVEDLEKFFVHLNLDKADFIAQKIEETVNAVKLENMQVLTPDHLFVGNICLIKVDETKFHRGIILDVTETDAEVTHTDYGIIDKFPFDKLFSLPGELQSYFYQAYECGLHNMSENVTVLKQDGLKCFENRELLICVKSIVDARLIVTLYDLDGVKLSLIEPDDNEVTTVDYVCPLPIYNGTQIVWISHIENVNSVYVQLSAQAELLPELLEKLFQHYSEGGDLLEPVVHSRCVALSANDENWYRAKITEISDEGVTVCFTDYGNTETVPKENIKALDKSFYLPHDLALNAQLGLKSSNDEAVIKLTELTMEKQLTGVLSNTGAAWLICLYDNEFNVNQELINLNLAEYCIFENPSQPGVETTPIESACSETKAKVIVTHIDSPSEFYLQLLENEAAIFNLQDMLRNRVDTFTNMDGADVGGLCAARYTIDEEWYRAEVLDADSDIITVRFLDYGNTDVISNEVGNIKTLPADLLAIDKYARKCSLNVSPINGEEWSSEAQELFESAVSTGDICADIVYQDERHKTFVELTVDNNNVANLLIEANLATHIVRNVEEKIANTTGFVSHLNSLSEFWIQLESSINNLEMICDRLANADEFPELQDHSPGMLCAANYSDDEMWYRARILSNTVAGIEVVFVDYGNSSTAVKLKVLPEDLVQMPMLAQKCSLYKPPHVEKWLEAATEKFRELSAEGVTVFTVKKLAAGETSTVELYIDGMNVADYLTQLSSADMETVTPCPKEESALVKAYLVYQKSPSFFYIQLDSDMEALTDTINKLEGAADFGPLNDNQPGTVCAVYCEEENMWYRGSINAHDTEYSVLLIDYGNVIHSKEVRELPEELSSIPALAILCALEMPATETDWSVTARDNFTKMFANAETDYQVQFLSKESPRTVKIFVEGNDVCAQLFKTTPTISQEVESGSEHCEELKKEIQKEETHSEQAELDNNNEDNQNDPPNLSAETAPQDPQTVMDTILDESRTIDCHKNELTSINNLDTPLISAPNSISLENKCDNSLNSLPLKEEEHPGSNPEAILNLETKGETTNEISNDSLEKSEESDTSNSNREAIPHLEPKIETSNEILTDENPEESERSGTSESNHEAILDAEAKSEILTDVANESPEESERSDTSESNREAILDAEAKSEISTDVANESPDVSERSDTSESKPDAKLNVEPKSETFSEISDFANESLEESEQLDVSESNREAKLTMEPKSETSNELSTEVTTESLEKSEQLDKAESKLKVDTLSENSDDSIHQTESDIKHVKTATSDAVNVPKSGEDPVSNKSAEVSRPKTPVEDKIVPGSINRGVDIDD